MSGLRRVGRISSTLAVVGALTLTLAACSGSSEPAGTETKPLYGGELFDSRTVIGFQSGEEMNCFESDADAYATAVICDWSQAPKVNLELKEEFRNDWTLVFLELEGGTTVCLARDWSGNADQISCNINGIER